MLNKETYQNEYACLCSECWGKTINSIFLGLIIGFLILFGLAKTNSTEAQDRCSDYCHDNVYYSNGFYNSRENKCDYQETRCEYGCDGSGTLCKSVSRESFPSDTQDNGSSLRSSENPIESSPKEEGGLSQATSKTKEITNNKDEAENDDGNEAKEQNNLPNSPRKQFLSGDRANINIVQGKDNRKYYKIEENEKTKLFGLFNVNFKVIKKYDFATKEKDKEKKPWWSIFAFSKKIQDVCGDKFCSKGEKGCEKDCGFCGDNICSVAEVTDPICWKDCSAEYPKYKIGDKGPAGGLVFYVFGECNKCEQATIPGGVYMELAPSSTVVKKIWGGMDQNIWGALDLKFAGKSNTEKIVSQIGKGDYAAKYCSDLEYGGFDDWFLPSIEELEIARYNWSFYENKFKVNFGEEESLKKEYWSSSAYYDPKDKFNYKESWYTGLYSYFWRIAEFNVRCVRQF